jgi:enamine deaminase RidA (YjgF/YER057c/UK114 family)
MSVYERLHDLRIDLPAPPHPVGAFVPGVQAGGLVFLSGHIARKNGASWSGRLGAGISVTEGQAAARAAAIDALGSLHAATGDLDRIKRIVKLLVLVNSADDFTEQHLVANGASELFGEVFDGRGLHARSAIGVAQLPLGSCVEVELVAEIE